MVNYFTNALASTLTHADSEPVNVFTIRTLALFAQSLSADVLHEHADVSESRALATVDHTRNLFFVRDHHGD